MTPVRHSGLRGSNERNVRNDVVGLLSVVPGLGHFYKGYRIMGLSLFLIGIPLVFFVSGIMVLATLGISLFFPFAFWGFNAWHAFEVKDHNHHHWFL